MFKRLFASSSKETSTGSSSNLKSHDISHNNPRQDDEKSLEVIQEAMSNLSMESSSLTKPKDDIKITTKNPFAFFRSQRSKTAKARNSDTETGTLHTTNTLSASSSASSSPQYMIKVTGIINHIGASKYAQQVFLTMSQVARGSGISRSEEKWLKSTIPPIQITRLNPLSKTYRLQDDNIGFDKKSRLKTADSRRFGVKESSSSAAPGNNNVTSSGYYSKFREKQEQSRIATMHGYEKPLDKKIRRSVMTSRQSITALNPYYKTPLVTERQQHHYNLDEIKMEKVKRKFMDFDGKVLGLKPYYFIPKKASDKGKEKRYSVNTLGGKAITSGAATNTSNTNKRSSVVSKARENDVRGRRARPRSTRREIYSEDLIELNLDKTDLIHEESPRNVKLTKADIDFNRFFEGKPSSAPPMSIGYYNRLFGT